MNIQLTIHLPEAIQKILTAAMVKKPTETDKPTESVNEPLRPTYRRLKFRGKTIRGLLIDNKEWFVLTDIFNALDCEGLIYRDCLSKAISDYSMECELEGKKQILVDRFGVFIVNDFSLSEHKKEFRNWFFSKAANLYRMED